MSEFQASNFKKAQGGSAPNLVGKVKLTSPYFFVPPSGDTASRPVSCAPGTIRFNTDVGTIEVYRGDTIGWEYIQKREGQYLGGAKATGSSSTSFKGSNNGTGTRGIVGGGTRAPAAVNEIRFITVSTMGADQDFGDLTKVKRYVVGVADRTRGLFIGGSPDSSPFGGLTDMEFITHSSTGNAIDFGDTSTTHRGAGCADKTRAVYTAGNVSPYNVINYVTIASAGASQDFGDLTDSDRSIDGSGCSSSTRGLFAGSYTPNPAFGRDDINFVTISSTGNATDFGTLSTITFAQQSSSSNSTRALFAGGYGGAPNTQNTIQFVTIATTGNTTDFGDLTNNRKRSQQVPSSTRAVIIGGGVAPSEGNVTSMEKVEFSTTGNSVDFGTLANGVQAGGYFSNGHGGL